MERISVVGRRSVGEEQRQLSVDYTVGTAGSTRITPASIAARPARRISVVAQLAGQHEIITVGDFQAQLPTAFEARRRMPFATSDAVGRVGL
jgi:hypothetical protein